MSAFWTAFAYAIEPSEATFSARAALIGAATLALISDIAARSGSSSPASSLSCSRVSFWNCCSSDTRDPSYVRLVDRGGLSRVGVRDRAVREDVRGNGRVDGNREVRVHERHRCALGKLLTGELFELFAGQLLELLLAHLHYLLVALVDRRRLLGVCDRGRVVRQRVQRHRGVDRRRNVGVQQGHRRPLGQLLARKLVQLLTGELLVLTHFSPPCRNRRRYPFRTPPSGHPAARSASCCARWSASGRARSRSPRRPRRFRPLRTRRPRPCGCAA